MELFKAELQRFIRGESDQASLVAAIESALNENPEYAARINSGLQRLADAGHLAPDVVAELVQYTESFSQRDSEDSTRFIAEDQTQIASRPIPDDQTQIASSPTTEDQTQIASGPIPDDQTVMAAGQEDKTQFAQAAPRSGSAQDRSGFTTPTSRTSGTSNTSTTSKWAKPFDEEGQVDHTLTVGSVIKERFRLVEFIGCGGMGDVFKAEDQRRIDAQDVESYIAIKVLNSNFRDHPESLRSLQREARKTQNLAHPNIVNVFDFDRDQHHVYMTMELMLGEPLNKVIKGKPRGLAVETVYRYVAEMGAALSYAHRSDIIHSDFKPSNIFLDQNTIKVFDFGIARAAKEGQADNFDAGELGALTPTYASPEMLDGQLQADPKDDIYALACITYELLSGKHPFLEKGKKVPADQARDKGLTPAPLKVLKRSQWKALSQGLSFDPARRTHSVDDFLQGFLPSAQPTGLMSKWYIWPVAATVLSAIAYFPARDFWEAKLLSDMADGLKNGDDADILALLDEIENMQEDERLTYFNDARVKSSLTKYFIGRMNDQMSDDQYAEAEHVAARALQIYEDSRRLSDQRELVSKRKAGRLNELNIELNQYLSASLNAFIAKVEALPALFDSIRKVDYKNPMLKDPRVPERMVEAIDWLAGKNAFSEAERVSTLAKGMFAGNDEITVAYEQMKQQQYRFEQTSQIEGYEASLAAATDIRALPDLDTYKDVVTELNRIAPQSAVLSTFKQTASPLAEQAISDLIAQNNWSDAQAQFEQYRGYLTGSVLDQLFVQIEQGRADQSNTQTRQKNAIYAAIEQGDLTQAAALIERFDAPENTQLIVAERLGRAFLKQARIARADKQWDQAVGLIESARTAYNDTEFSSLLNDELQIIEVSRAATDSAQLEQIQAERAAELNQHQQTLNTMLQQPVGSVALEDIQGLLDKVEQLQPDHALLQDIPQRLASGYLNQAEHLTQQSDHKVALELLNQFNTAFPGNASVDQRMAELDSYLKTQAEAQRYNDTEQQITQLLTQVSQNPNWQAELNQLTDQLQGQGATEAQLNALNTTIALQLSQQAMQYSDDKRFDPALEMLGKAAEYDPALGTLAGLEQQIRTSQADWEAERQLRKQQAEIQGLKQTLQTQLQANDLPRAEQSLEKLKGLLGPDSPYIQSEAHPAFVDTYLRLADQLARQTRLTKAAELLESARKYSVDTTVIDEKIAGYKRDAKLWRIGQATRSISLDSFTSAHQLLTEIEAELAPERAEKLHKGLTDAVIARYQQLKGSRPEAALKLLQKARGLYPDHAGIQGIELPAVAPKPAAPKAEPAPAPAVVEPETKPEPVVAKPAVTAPAVTATGKACTSGLAGLGRNVKAVCYDMVSAQTKGPYMVVVPGGAGGPFAISKFEISNEDYNAYCQQTGCNTRAGNGRSPATGISYSQAAGYAQWLTKVTGKQYRLPEYTQWKYAALSGNKRQPNNFNCRLMQGETILKGHAPVSVRNGKANNWGIVNYLGNVQEWVTDNGAAKAAGGHYADKMSSCSVDLIRTASTDAKTGFRLVRSL
ncbi:protein kinase domain-containing protein [Aliamphritea ceti]|uniref:protein kinase domain-containing protein n=1 Tax=Aliamphritea ceti TaxID=1524258 RepID=UPI0021C269C4|nr:protein kinase [Aliamphritea ceti]